MNRGLCLKAAIELWPITLGFGLALFLIEGVLAYVLPTFQQQFAQQLTQLQFAQTFVKALLGADMGKNAPMGPEMILSIVWVHPVVLALVWAHAILACTRVPAGEVDRGTIDVLLGMPVSRWDVYRSETAVWLTSGVLLMGAAIAGNMLGASRVTGSATPDFARSGIVLANLFCLYVAAGGLAWLMSALSDRKGRAMTIVFILVITSFLVSYLAQLWQPAERLAFLSVLNYYRPLFVLRDGVWPLRDMGVLVGVGAALWLTGGIVFARRDLCTV